MRYLSLFSGIGGFEVAIHQKYGDEAICVAYSEIDKHAIEEYERHYPNHNNLGDVTKIKKTDIDFLGKIDLIVGGFPCSDLSSVKHKGRQGLDGEKSGLFWTLINILKWAKKNNPDLKIIIENNVSMAHKWRDMITSELAKVFKKNVYCNYFDSSQWVVQRRRRYYWTLKEISEYQGKKRISVTASLDSIKNTIPLAVSPAIIKLHNSKYLSGNTGLCIDIDKKTIENVNYNTRWKSVLSKSSNDYVKCITTSKPHNLILDLRDDRFIIRYFSKKELNKFFGFPKDYVKTSYSNIFQKLYGMSVVPNVIFHILEHL